MNKNHSPYIYIYIALAFMLLIASCDKPQSENGGAKPKHSFSFLQASHRIERTANSYTQEVTETNKPTDDDRTIAYSSSNDDIATVDNKGVVEFKTAGTVTIKAEKQQKGKHLGRSAQYTLYITVKPTGKAALKAEIKRATKAHGGTVDLNYIDTSLITDMNDMFKDDAAFNGDISKWKVSQVTTMRNMFEDATAFNQDISAWNVSQVTNMVAMFYEATAFNQDISEWNVSQVTDMESMFTGAVVFNQDISAWNVSQVTDMSYMFVGATAFNQNISAWEVSQVTNMGYMFYGATVFNQNISAWNVSKVIDMRFMFQDATAFNQNLESWGKKLHETIKASSMAKANNMFKNSGASVPAWCTGYCDHTSTR